MKLTPLDMGAAISTGLTIYDRDKIIAAQASAILEEEMLSDEDLLLWLREFKGQNLLIYSRDTHYFSLIRKEDPDMWATSIVTTFLRLIRDVGEVVGYEIESTHIELWVRLNNGEVGQFMAFDFDRGVIAL